MNLITDTGITGIMALIMVGTLPPEKGQESFTVTPGDANPVSFTGIVRPADENTLLLAGMINGNRAIAVTDFAGNLKWGYRLKSANSQDETAAHLVRNGDGLFAVTLSEDRKTGHVGNFETRSLLSEKAVRWDFPAGTQATSTMTHDSLPPKASLIADSGNTLRVMLFSAAGELEIDQAYSLPFLDVRPSPPAMDARGALWPLADGSGHYLIAHNASGGEGTVFGVIRLGPKGAVIWAKEYQTPSSKGFEFKIAHSPDGCLIGTLSSKTQSSVFKIDRSGDVKWTKKVDIPHLKPGYVRWNSPISDFTIPYFYLCGMVPEAGNFCSILIAMAPDTGEIVHQTQFPEEYSTVGIYCSSTQNSLYFSTMEIKKLAMNLADAKFDAAMFRFDKELNLMGGLEIVDAYAIPPMLITGDEYHVLSYNFPNPNRLVAVRLNENLETTGKLPSWLRYLSLTMRKPSYGAVDAVMDVADLDISAEAGNSELKTAEMELQPFVPEILAK